MGKAVSSSTVGSIIATGVLMAVILFLSAPPATIYISGRSVMVGYGVLFPIIVLTVTFTFAILIHFGGKSYDRWRSYAPTIYELEAEQIMNLTDRISKVLVNQPDVYDSLCPSCLQSPGWDGDASKWPTYCSYCGKELDRIPKRWHSESSWLDLVLTRLRWYGILDLRGIDVIFALPDKKVSLERDLLTWLGAVGAILDSRDLVLLEFHNPRLSGS